MKNDPTEDYDLPEPSGVPHPIVAYVAKLEAQLVAYMPVPRCDKCKRWQPREDQETGFGGLREDTGFCGLREEQDIAKMWPEMEDGIVTQADFGCVQFAASVKD